MVQFEREELAALLTFWAARKGIDPQRHAAWLSKKARVLSGYGEVYQREQKIINPKHQVQTTTAADVLDRFNQKPVVLDRLKKLITAMPLQVLNLDASKARAVAELHHFLFAALWERESPPDAPYPQWCSCKLCREAGLLPRRIEHMTEPMRFVLDDWAMFLAMRTRSFGDLALAHNVVVTMAMELARLASVHCGWLGGKPPTWQQILRLSKKVSLDRRRTFFILGRLYFAFRKPSNAEVWDGVTALLVSGCNHSWGVMRLE